MKTLVSVLSRSLVSALPVFALLHLSACNSSTPAETTAAPAAAAPADANAIPELASLGSVDIKPGIELQLPTSFLEHKQYLSVLSAQVIKATPMVMPVPASWAVGTGAALPQKGYRINYEAQLVWKPITVGLDAQTATKMPFGLPVKADSLAVFYADDIEHEADYKTSTVEPNKPFKVTGTLYAYLQNDGNNRPTLVVFPYAHHNTPTSQALTKHYLPIK
jgi:hypothetical protein